MRVYCASPYSSSATKQVVANILHAERVGVEVRALGHVPVGTVNLNRPSCSTKADYLWRDLRGRRTA